MLTHRPALQVIYESAADDDYFNTLVHTIEDQITAAAQADGQDLPNIIYPNSAVADTPYVFLRVLSSRGASPTDERCSTLACRKCTEATSTGSSRSERPGTRRM